MNHTVKTEDQTTCTSHLAAAIRGEINCLSVITLNIHLKVMIMRDRQVKEMAFLRGFEK